MHVVVTGRVRWGVPEPEWSDFKILIALKRGGSVTGAARILNVDHSTVSRRLVALETAVGACLIVRNGREFSWTAAGRTLLAAAEAVQPIIETATRDVQSQRHGAEGTVRVSLPPAFLSVISRLLLAERARHPELTIELLGENRSADLVKGEADIALRMFRPTEPGLVHRQVLEFAWVACAAQIYIDAHGLPESPADLPNHSIVRYVDTMHRVAGPRWLEDNRGCARTATVVDETEIAGQSIASGAGIGVIPLFVAEARKPDIVQVFREPVAYTTGYLVYHETLRDVARVKGAVQVLGSILENNAKLFSGDAKAKANAVRARGARTSEQPT